MYEEKRSIIICPSCGKTCYQVVSGDLDSGWQEDGSYETGVVTVGYDCPYCGDADADVFVHD
jgi:predicted RNA-binding Zn-ribbon protein involved in translation (DUF1610 family)